jgi:hypothetical protein
VLHLDNFFENFSRHDWIAPQSTAHTICLSGREALQSTRADARDLPSEQNGAVARSRTRASHEPHLCHNDILKHDFCARPHLGTVFCRCSPQASKYHFALGFSPRNSYNLRSGAFEQNKRHMTRSRLVARQARKTHPQQRRQSQHFPEEISTCYQRFCRYSISLADAVCAWHG